jgi:uncharacterized coiled-coil protein SlyX
MGRTFRRNDTYGYKQDYRERNKKQLKKLNKKLRKITGNRDNKQIQAPPPQEGTELV